MTASTVLIQQVPFSFSRYRSLAYILMCRYLLFKFALPFSLAWTYKRLVQPYRGFLWLCRYSITFLRTFFYPRAHPVDASFTRCRLNRRKFNTYRETRPPSWENGTWQVPSQLSHSEHWELHAERLSLPALYSYLKWRILKFTRWNWKCLVIIVIKTDMSGFIVTMHWGMCEQYVESLGLTV